MIRSTRTSSADEVFKTRVESHAVDLSRSFRRVLDAIPGSPHRAADLARRFRLNKDIASRLIRASQADDPLTTAHIIPGPEPLTKLLKSLSGVIPSRLTADAQRSLNEFNRFVAEHAGDRSGLDAILALWLTEAQNRHQLVAKQTAFKGMSLVKGLSAKVMHTTHILWPNVEHMGRGDRVVITGVHGLVGLRPGAALHLQSEHIMPNPNSRRLTLERKPISSLEDLCLEGFCTRQFAGIVASPTRSGMLYSITPRDIGLTEAADYVVAELILNSAGLYRHKQDAERSYAWFSTMVSIPSRVMLVDVLLHRDVYKEVVPVFRQHDTALRGIADCNDPMRDIDLLHFNESIEELGRGLDNLNSPDLPKHQSCVAHVMERVNLCPADFRAYRCRVEYPVYGSQTSIAFQRPHLPAHLMSHSSSDVKPPIL